MNWDEAVDAMRQGAACRRKVDSVETVVSYDDLTEITVVDSGTEPTRLMAAWTDDDKPVFVFAGAWSKVMFVPGDRHRSSTDWEVVDGR
jgi:hypothetical protein